VSAPRFFVERLAEGLVHLSSSDTRHALRSLRLRPGAEILLADGTGQVGWGRLRGEERSSAVVEVERIEGVTRPVPWLEVILAPPTGDRLTWAVQKLAELGVDRLTVTGTDRSVRRWGTGGTEAAVVRLRAVAREAAMQSRQAFVMEVGSAPSLPVALDSGSRPSRTILLWEGGGGSLLEAMPGDGRAVRLVVGPEGGFTQDEVDLAASRDAVPASLGPNILRTETAAVAAAAVALARSGRLG
jgi:16S rRNA (uracil1498-N3)-methyltransferase